MSKISQNKILIFSILAAILIIGGAIGFVKLKQVVPVIQQEKVAHFDGEKLEVKPMYQACAVGDSCIVVDTHCGFCCQYTAINARYEDDFDSSYNKNCSKYQGEYCDCFDLSSYPDCVDSRCQLVKWPN